MRRYKMVPRERFLSQNELKRLGFVLDHADDTRAAAAIRLLLFTGARSSEIWLGPEAARLLAEMPRPAGRKRVFPEDLTPDRLYTLWVGIREEAGLPGLRIHDTRHTWASQGVMNGVGLTTVGRLLGHRQRETTAIYAHLDDAALQDAAAQAAAVIARAMGYRAEPPSMKEEADDAGNVSEFDRSESGNRRKVPPDPLEPTTTADQPSPLDWMDSSAGRRQNSPQRWNIDCTGDEPLETTSDSADGTTDPSQRQDSDWL